MTKRELVVRISAETGIPQQDVYSVLQKSLDHMIDSLVKGDTIEFRNFGVFEVRMRRARKGFNPARPDATVQIPPRRVVRFKPGKLMKERVLAGGSAGGEAERAP